MELLLFGIAREIAGKNKLHLPVNEDYTVQQIKEKVKLLYPSFSKLTSLAVAVNGEYANDNDIVTANSEIAIIPPVSGG